MQVKVGGGTCSKEASIRESCWNHVLKWFLFTKHNKYIQSGMSSKSSSTGTQDYSHNCSIIVKWSLEDVFAWTDRFKTYVTLIRSCWGNWKPSPSELLSHKRGIPRATTLGLAIVYKSFHPASFTGYEYDMRTNFFNFRDGARVLGDWSPQSSLIVWYLFVHWSSRQENAQWPSSSAERMSTTCWSSINCCLTYIRR